MDEKKRNIIIRFAIVFVLLTIVGVCVVVKIAITQTVERESWLKYMDQQVPSIREQKANRGNIYDCNGRLLASSVPTYQVFMDTYVPALHDGHDTLFTNNIDSLAFCLAAYFKDKSASAYKSDITGAFNLGLRRYPVVKGRISYSQMKDMRKMPLIRRGRMKSGFIFEPAYQRIKPFGLLASRSIGQIYAESGKGGSGLELRYDDELHGESGTYFHQKIAGSWADVTVVEPVDGCDIVTTIDVDLQDIVEQALLNAFSRTSPEWGCCMLMETKTGELKAIANLDRCADGCYAEKMNHAVTRVEPGSTFKTITLMAALDDGKLDMEDTFHVYRSGWHYGVALHKDAHARDTVYDVKDALAASSNIAFAKMAIEAYDRKATKFVDKLRRMGICDSLCFDIPGTQKPRIDVPKDGVTLSKMAYGYSVELPPINILAFYNGIANDGCMIEPFLVKEIRRDGEVVESYETRVVKNSMCSQGTLNDVRQCLHEVVWNDQLGTAAPYRIGKNIIFRKAQSELVHIAGKTGTAQLIMNGHYRGDRHRMTFVGYFPEEDPQYTCLCMIEHPHNYGGYDAGIDCGGVVRVIAERTMAMKGKREIEEMKRPYDSLTKPTIKRGVQASIRTACKGTKVKVKSCDDEWARINENYEADGLVVTSIAVPNVMGMGAKDAVYAIEQTGMIARCTGRGRVVSQSIPGGTGVVKGATVYLELR